MSHDNWKHISPGRQEYLCGLGIIATTTMGAALAIWFVMTTEQVL